MAHSVQLAAATLRDRLLREKLSDATYPLRDELRADYREAHQ